MVQVLERPIDCGSEFDEGGYPRIASDRLVGNIPRGTEPTHIVLSDTFSEIVLCFNATVDMLHAPVVDGDDTILDNVGRVEVHTENSEMYLLTRGVDEHGHTTHSVLFHDGVHQRALSSIDCGDDGQFTEQHTFRYAYGALIEGTREPLQDSQYGDVFEHIINLVMSDQARIVVEA